METNLSRFVVSVGDPIIKRGGLGSH
jgi:hypothetical protein